ncbi:MAG TPA: contractile injection system tape measure protein, partial [Candidatus Manganitrophaceae bacterium]|nr:contractile injection system tape measure protein [Candidatus Manganitrophaceae bacterium]
MASSRHRIRRVRWQVKTGSSGEAFSVRKRLQEEWESVLPVFEALFDAAAVGDEVIRIPKLELRVTVDAG